MNYKLVIRGWHFFCRRFTSSDLLGQALADYYGWHCDVFERLPGWMQWHYSGTYYRRV